MRNARKAVTTGDFFVRTSVVVVLLLVVEVDLLLIS